MKKRKQNQWVTVLAGIGVILQGGCAHALERQEITKEYVIERARQLASEAYKPSEAPLPEYFKKIGYDQYRDIRFRQVKALWLEERLPFQIQLFHRGYLFQDPVFLREFSPTHVQKIPYVHDFFRFENQDIENYPPADAGYAGWRLHAPINRPEYYDEVIAFLGASYFRAVGKDQKYGLSARGLIIPHNEANTEIFPRFTQFWLAKPIPDSNTFQAFALLDSEKVTGAYAFRVTPGAPTQVDVEVTLFPRENLDKVGLAPFTSMFWYGENSQPKPMDFRPEVHDSDGLYIKYKDGTEMWRPLEATNRERITEFSGNGMAMTVLFQRDRNFDNYLDTESDYGKRPSLMMVPGKSWVPGKMVLRELPPRGEYDDNIVVYYAPEETLLPGKRYHFNYTLNWGDFSRWQQIGRVQQTRHGRDLGLPNAEVFIIEYAPPEGGFSQNLELNVDIKGDATLREKRIEYDENNGMARVHLILIPDSTEDVFLEVVLNLDGKPATEIWNYRWSPLN